MDPSDLDILTTGATGLPASSLDTRVPGAGTLAGSVPAAGPGSSPMTTTPATPRTASTRIGSKADCSASNATKANNSGCLNDLFPFVMATYSATNKSQGNSMGFYNAEQEQAPILKMLADRFTLSDNFHQSFHGGTGANHFMLGTGDAAFWSDGNGNPATPPANLIANPNPQAGTVNQLHGRRQLQRLRRLQPARRQADRELSRMTCPTRRSRTASPTTSTCSTTPIPASCRTARWSGGSDRSAVVGPDHRRCPDREEHFVGLLRRRL